MQVRGQSGGKESAGAVHVPRLARSSCTGAASPREVIDAEFVYGGAYGRGSGKQCVRGECGGRG
jgi:hypothetical protein